MDKDGERKCRKLFKSHYLSDVFNTIIISLFSLMHPSFNIIFLHLFRLLVLFRYFIFFFLPFRGCETRIFEIASKIKLFERCALIFLVSAFAIALINVCIPVIRDALQILRILRFMLHMQYFHASQCMSYIIYNKRQIHWFHWLRHSYAFIFRWQIYQINNVKGISQPTNQRTNGFNKISYLFLVICKALMTWC